MTFGLGPHGFKRKRYADIIADKEVHAKALFGEDVNLSERSPLGMFIKINAWDEAKLWEELEKVYNSGYKDTSEGVQLDHVVKYIGIGRKLAVEATGEITITGDNGTIIPAGFLVSTKDDIQFKTTEEVTISDSGTATAVVEAVVAGAGGNVPANTITVIVNPTAGVSAVNNQTETTNGQDQETDSKLRERYDESLAKGGSSTVESIMAALLEVENVIDALVDENVTDTPVNGIPAKSIAPLVYGGNDTDVANAIFKGKSGGIQSYGSTTVEVIDSMSKSHTIGFTRPTMVDIYVDVTLTTDSDFPTDGKDQVTTEVIKYIGGTDADAAVYYGTGLDEDIIHYKVITAIAKVPGIVDVEVQIGLSSTTLGTANIDIASNEVAQTDNTKVTVA